MRDKEKTIHAVGKFHGVPGVATIGRQRRKRDGVGAEGNDVVGADHALVAKAEAVGEIEACGQGAKVALGFAGGDGEALVVGGAEMGEDVVGGVEIAGLGEAEFADQAVLAGAPGALFVSERLFRLRFCCSISNSDAVSPSGFQHFANNVQPLPFQFWITDLAHGVAKVGVGQAWHPVRRNMVLDK